MVSVVAEQPKTFADAFQRGYARLFEEQWPYWVGGILLGLTNVFLFAYARPWSAADGVRNWGDWVFNSVNILDKNIIPPHLYSTSVLNFGLIVGALAAALLARQFKIRMAPGRELGKGLVGGLLMGVGASMAFGCNIGGFFSATSALSMAGLAMMVGLMIGAYLGLRLLLLEIEYLPPLAGHSGSGKTSETWKNRQPIIGVLVLAGGLALAFIYDGFDYAERGGILLFGLFIGTVMQRTRFCFVRAFREPFMTGNGDATKAVALAIIISVTGFSILKWTDLREWETMVSSGFWVGSLIGGIIFGIGMSFTGGCATGSMWRAAEGQVKLWIALVGFTFGGSYFRAWMDETGWTSKLGQPVFIPDIVGWKLGIIGIIVLMLLWYMAASWNEVKGKLVAT